MSFRDWPFRTGFVMVWGVDGLPEITEHSEIHDECFTEHCVCQVDCGNNTILQLRSHNQYRSSLASALR